MIFILISLFSCGVLLGYILGYSAGLYWSFDKAMVLMEKQGISITFDEAMIKAGLLQYQDNIGGCLFVEAINKTG